MTAGPAGDGTAGDGRDAGLPGPDEVLARLGVVRARIAAAGGDPAAVTVIGVTKGQPPPVVPLALAAGLVDLGENYAQELLDKVRWWQDTAPAGPAPRWHAIGRLQRNKVRALAPYVTVWQALDRAELVDEVARRAPGARVLIQVNATGEAGKGGCPAGETPTLVARATGAGLHVEGLMTVGPTDADVDPRPGFDLVRGLVDRLGLEVCSMGMTDDLEAAVGCGSTMVRIGTALFGPRRPRPVRD
jgi:pyridoxal phosphate enzyme (YggS family)